MPIFDFRCSECSDEFEAVILSNSAPAECPSCSSRDLEKLISRSAISSPQTRSNARQELKRRNSSIRTELAHEEHKRFHDHDH